MARIEERAIIELDDGQTDLLGRDDTQTEGVDFVPTVSGAVILLLDGASAHRLRYLTSSR
jgi:hypothetical protein